MLFIVSYSPIKRQLCGVMGLIIFQSTSGKDPMFFCFCFAHSYTNSGVGSIS